MALPMRRIPRVRRNYQFYIVSGEITVEGPGGNIQRHFTAGQVVLIVFYAGVKGMPLAESKP